VNTSELSPAERVVRTRMGGKVERCHGIPHVGSYNVAAHSWGVAMLLAELWPADFQRLALVALSHDVPEAWVGDIPAPVMRWLPGFAEKIGSLEAKLNADLNLPTFTDLPAPDYEKVKTCDLLEFWLWCRDQLAYGNTFVAEGLREVERYIASKPLPSPAQDLYQQLQTTSVNARQAGVIATLVKEIGA